MTDETMPTPEPQGGMWFDHRTLLRDTNNLLTVYDRSARGVLDLAYKEGYFEGVDPDLIRWPPSQTPGSPIGLEGLGYRAKLIGAIAQGVTGLRDTRLYEAYQQFVHATPAYHESTRMYAQVKRQFLAQGKGAEQDYLQLYQTVYVEMLRHENLFTPDEGEAALEQARLSRVPLSHARPVAEKLKAMVAEDDPQWATVYRYTLHGETTEAPLRDIFRDIAGRTLDYLSVGELIAVRYNTYSNFAWFGSSVWKALSEADLLVETLRRTAPPGVVHHQLDGLKDDILLGQSMMVEFFQAHQENPVNLKPTGYWYGHPYTSLTRDMIDLTMKIISAGNRLLRQAGPEIKKQESLPSSNAGDMPPIQPLQIPELFTRRGAGRFLEYPGVGRFRQLPAWKRVLKLARWIWTARSWAAYKMTIAEEALPEPERLEKAWRNNLWWADATLRIFDVEVNVHIDPAFADVAKDLDLAGGNHKILFFPIHQSVFDHFVTFHTLHAPALLDALGWDASRPSTILSRSNLTDYVTLRIGSWSTTMFGISAAEWDRLLEEVDGYVILPRSGDTGNATQRFADLLDHRPGVIYAAGTTAAFDIQSIPLQHGLFSKLPPDVVLIPMAYRGIHSIWPKSPRGNIRINPGRVDVVVAPPMLGETTLFPRRRSLRPQLEPAALFQAVQIVHLLNPEKREG